MYKAPYVIEPPTRFEDGKITEAELLHQVKIKEKRENVCMACLGSICTALSLCCVF